jgi:hypothetical protein
MSLIPKGFLEAPAAGFTSIGLKTSPREWRRFDENTLKSLGMFPVRHLVSAGIAWFMELQERGGPLCGHS